MSPLAVLLALAGYLFGGVPFGVLLTRVKGVNLFQVGSGNIGATNVVRAVGFKWGLMTWLADTLKGMTLVLVARLLGQPEAVWASTGIAAVVGHCFSPYLHLRGGKGIATSLGVLLAFDWRVGCIAFALWIVVMVGCRIVSVASLAAAVTLLPLVLFLHDTPTGIVLAGALTSISVIRHKENIERLLRGEEKPFGDKSRAEQEVGARAVSGMETDDPPPPVA